MILCLCADTGRFSLFEFISSSPVLLISRSASFALMSVMLMNARGGSSMFTALQGFQFCIEGAHAMSRRSGCGVAASTASLLTAFGLTPLSSKYVFTRAINSSGMLISISGSCNSPSHPTYLSVCLTVAAVVFFLSPLNAASTFMWNICLTMFMAQAASATFLFDPWPLPITYF
ncbi:hypothetical protein WR25_08191 [Diploscapter pachys]|uniref:Uncharacterized protein n=1 Tax=Diploscapter pachys TaxID=2018661 RepID=A0A2A2LA18_9BILA|nr:hypothetical protein WR25_08191 [Diploscapter pachys]